MKYLKTAKIAATVSKFIDKHERSIQKSLNKYAVRVGKNYFLKEDMLQQILVNEFKLDKDLVSVVLNQLGGENNARSL